MQIVVVLLVLAGIAAVGARFLLGTAGTGAVQLPRIVDDSIGMWLLRRTTGRQLGDREDGGASVVAAPSGPRRFDPEIARRMGIRRASELVPTTRARSDRRADRTGLSPVAIGVLAAAAIVAGLAVGTGMALIVPRG